MLPKSSRLTRLQLAAVIKEGLAAHTPNFSYKTLKNNNAPSRFAVAVSTKNAKRAVDRNRVRRTVYDALPRTSQGADVVIFPKSQVINLTRDQIITEINTLLSKIFGVS